MATSAPEVSAACAGEVARLSMNATRPTAARTRLEGEGIGDHGEQGPGEDTPQDRGRDGDPQDPSKRRTSGELAAALAVHVHRDDDPKVEGECDHRGEHCQ